MAIYNYLVAAGGSGIKTVEALVHLATIGYLKTAEPINLAVIDMDQANKNLDTLVKTLEAYIKVQDALDFREKGTRSSEEKEAIPCCQTRFLMQNRSKPDKTSQIGDLVWAPVVQQKQTLSGILKGSRSEAEKLLMQTLFSRDELTENLSGGFKGHPAIGSVLMSNQFTLDLKLDELPPALDINQKNNQLYWSRFFGEESNLKSSMTPDNQFRILVVGSIFGGTGASVVPTIVKKLQDRYQDEIAAGVVQIGIVPLLPYFGIQSAGHDKKNDGNLMAQDRDFVQNSRYALTYYQEIGILEQVRRIYLIGSDFRDKLPFGISGTDQWNKPLMVELIAALGICNFFTSNQLNPATKVVLVRRNERSEDSLFNSRVISIREIPDHVTLQKKIHDFARFAIASLIYQQRMQKIAQAAVTDPIRKRENWFTQFFRTYRSTEESQDLLRRMDQVISLNAYFMSWLIRLCREDDQVSYCTDAINVNDLERFYGAVDPLNVTDSSAVESSAAGFEFSRLGYGNKKTSVKSVMLNLPYQPNKTELTALHHFCAVLYRLVQTK